MEETGITEFSIRILLLFLPGVICSYLVDTLTIHPPREPIFFVIRALVLGFASYFLYWATIHGLHLLQIRFLPDHVSFLKALEGTNAPIDFHEILYVCITSLFISLGMTVESTYKLTHRFFGFLKVTRKFGELDVWGFALNSKDVEWVTVRVFSEDLVYDGWINAFSDDGKDAELLLRDVSVYRNSTGEFLYEVGAIYLSPDRKAVSLEFRSIPVTIEAPTTEHQDAPTPPTPTE
jgi:hypothetical protein